VPLSVTFDLEDHRRSTDQEARFVTMTDRFLAFAEARGIRATVFVVGEIARSHPQLVRRVAAAGHELGLHGLRHVPLGQVGRGRLRAELDEGKALLEDAGGVPVDGFRAPIFSLTPSTAWALDDLADAGFAYSSSVVPAANPLHGWPGAPATPFRWGDGGLVELPCPVTGVGRAQIPFLGGIYLRYVPRGLARRALARLPAGAAPWSYVHPYDLDPDEAFFVMPHASWLVSRIIHTRRGATLRCLSSVLAAADGPGPPLRELAAEAGRRDLPVVPCAA
jgi:polysaccharide deacetylase family protein (PEP-CTERM system associated)